MIEECIFYEIRTIITGIVKFEFYGTKLRLISSCGAGNFANNKISIDGGSLEEIYTIPQHARQYIAYEKANLSVGRHTVEITLGSAAFGLDAIDIDLTGYLVDPTAITTTGISLDKKSLDMTVGGKSEQLATTITPDNATKKDVTWTSSDESIATVDSEGIVTAKKEGQAIITATTTDGSNLSDTCTVTVSQNGRAILRITMGNNERKEFDVSMDEILKFVDWYNNNSNPSYSITETSNIKPFNSRTDYIGHDKIASFEVNQYTNN